MSIQHTVVRLPIVHLPAVVLPGATLTLALATDDLRDAVAAANEQTDQRLLLATSVEPDLGVVARVPNVGNLPTGESAAVVQIEARARIRERHVGAGSVTFADAEPIVDGEIGAGVEAATRELRATLELIAEQRHSRRLPELLRTVQHPGALADAVATWAQFSDEDRLLVLRAVDVADRVDAIHSWARSHLNELLVAETIRNDVSEGMDRQQREYLLRQQLNAIRRELGEEDDDVAADYRARLDALDAPESVKATIGTELDRLERMSTQSPEHSWIRTWLDRIFELPWGERTLDNVDLEAAGAVLDADHYGLDDVKGRIIEFLATRKLRRDRAVADRPDATAADDSSAGSRRHDGAIITLVGPPGVGKTSLGASIARAMGREFVRIALGGVRDEAEIRGHRRTYVGSQPGRIARALREAGTMNPVILLDEVDKLNPGGWSGDPTAALLEVLDPAQNHTFRDHYLEVDLDLSGIVFIATANVSDTIPAPLLDRMELVRLDGYTEAEKTFIARRYLLPRQIDHAGLRPDEVTMNDDVIRALIGGHTREAGVRSLERVLARLVRKVTAQVATGSATPITIEPDALTEWVGRPNVDVSIPERTDTPGVATGLAVTGVGGDVLFIETTAFPTGADGEPGLTLTGQLGDVMKESAQIALNYVRSHADDLGLEPDSLHRRFHVHVPAGAVPKDGPSAGITMTTALVSLVTERPVNSSLGMTGEITLQGRVLPIGGLKQKVLAAHRMGLTDVVIPKRNESDLDDVPDDVRAVMTFHPVADYAEVLDIAFG